MSNRRAQTPKPRRSREQQAAIMDLRNGSRTSPVPSGSVYKRPKSNSRRWRDYRED